MPEFIALLKAALEDPTIRAFIISSLLPEITKVSQAVAHDLFHRAHTDPKFLAQSDAVWQQRQNAKTQEEHDAADIALRNLLKPE